MSEYAAIYNDILLPREMAQMLLIDTQHRHAEELDDRGIIDKGRQSLIQKYHGNPTKRATLWTSVNQLIRVAVARQVIHEESHDKKTTVEVPSLIFLLPDRGPHPYVGVAEVRDGSMSPIGAFDIEDASLVYGMVCEVEKLRGEGKLPDVHDNLATFANNGETASFNPVGHPPHWYKG